MTTSKSDTTRDVTVQRYNPSLRVAWDDFVRSAPDASIYHGTWWMDVVSRCFSHENVSLLAWDDQGRIRAVLPLFRVKGWREHRLVSVPLRDQGGILGDVAGTHALLREAVALTGSNNCAYLTLKQGGELPEQKEIRENGLIPFSHWVTNEVALPLALTSNTIKGAALRNVRKAERTGVTVELGADAILAERFYWLFRETRKRLGVPTYSRHFFLTLATFPEQVKIILCSKDERDLAGAVILFSNRKAAYGYAANSLSRRELRAADLVVWKAIHWASDQGLTVFDFGADSPLQTELIRFKQKWGAQPRLLHYYYYLHKAKRIPTQDNAEPKWKLIRKSISLLPDVIFDTFSHWAVKHVD